MKFLFIPVSLVVYIMFSSAWIYFTTVTTHYHLASMPEGPSLDMVGDGSSSGQPALHRCDNPWKPNAQHGQSEVKTHDLHVNRSPL